MFHIKKILDNSGNIYIIIWQCFRFNHVEFAHIAKSITEVFEGEVEETYYIASKARIDPNEKDYEGSSNATGKLVNQFGSLKSCMFKVGLRLRERNKEKDNSIQFHEDADGSYKTLMFFNFLNFNYF